MTLKPTYRRCGCRCWRINPHDDLWCGAGHGWYLSIWALLGSVRMAHVYVPITRQKAADLLRPKILPAAARRHVTTHHDPDSHLFE